MGQDQFGVLTPGDSGANRVYDFSQMTTERDDTLIFKRPAERTWGNLLPGNIIYYKSNDTLSQHWLEQGPTGLTYHGNNIVNFAGEYADLTINPAEPVLKASNQYLDTTSTTTTQFTKFFVGHNMGNLPFVVDSIKRWIRHRKLSKFDGWGTLQLPGGVTYPVLRERIVHHMSNRGDYLKRSPREWLVDTNPDEYSYLEYRYWAQGTGWPVLEVIDYTMTGIVENYVWVRGTNQTTSLPVSRVAMVSTYPNPVTDQLNVRTDQTDNWQLTNAIGQVVRQGQSTETAFSISLADLPTGMYQLRIGQTISKVVKR